MTDLTLDHVIIAVADLELAAGALSEVLGRAPSWRGRHPTYGTANVLFRLDNAYVELLAPDPDATSDTAWRGSLGRFIQEKGAGLFTVAFATPDIAATVDAARSRGLPVDDPADGEGVDLDTGAVRRWTNTRISPDATRGTRTMFIQHRSPPEALPLAQALSEEAAAANAVLAVGIESRVADDAHWVWSKTFALPEQETDEGWSYDLGNARIYLSDGEVSGADPDRWSILVCQVPDIAEAEERLGVDYEEAEFAGMPGLLTSVAGASILLTEGA